MKKALVVFAAVLAAGGLWAQGKSQEEAEQAVVQAMRAQQSVMRIYQVNPDNLERVRMALWNIVGGGGKNISADPATNVLVVTTSPELAPALDELVKRLDVATLPPKNIELTFYVVQASKEPFADAGPVPPELQSALTQIKSIFTYQNFRLLDTLFARSRSSERISTSGQVALVKDHAAGLELSAQPSILSSTTPPRIRLHELSFRVRAMSGTSFTNIGLSADLDFNAGQKVVIGKTGVQDGQSALILVATGRIVD